MKKITAILTTLCFVTTLAGQSFLTASFDDQILINAKKAFQNNDPVITQAVRELVESAERAMLKGPWTVTEKTIMPPSGDKRDYKTLAPFWWPDTTKSDGLPYIRRDGIRNPSVFDFPERENMRAMSQAVLYLALAYYYTGEQRFADRAAEFVRIWFLDPELGMNPNLNFGQAIRGRNTGRGAGMIESRFIVEVVNGVMLMRGSDAWSNENDQKMQTWVNDFLNWADTSRIGNEENRAMNNHGTYFEMQRVAFAIFTGQYDRGRNYIQNSAKRRIFHQQTEDGQMPLEQARTMSLHYYTFNLGAMFQVAIMADKLGIDFFNYVDEQGRSIKVYMDFITPYYIQEKEWQWPQIRPFDFGRAAAILNTAAEKLNNPKYAQAAKQIGVTPIWQVLLMGQYQTER